VKPGDRNKSTLVLNVNPVAPSYADSFAPEAVYELKVDTNADAVADIEFFGLAESGLETLKNELTGMRKERVIE
jgi:hypothetical protein